MVGNRLAEGDLTFCSSYNYSFVSSDFLLHCKIKGYDLGCNRGLGLEYKFRLRFSEGIVRIMVGYRVWFRV